MAVEWTGKDFKKIKKKQLGRKNSRRIGDALEIQTAQYFRQKGFLAFRVPQPKKRSRTFFQQKGPLQKMDVLVIIKAIAVQCKRRQKYMTRSEIDILKKECKEWPETELLPELVWLDKGLRFRDL